ncbi:hypothetical protein EJ04DRAFT_566087 [Polyplosphaeria fusca]|uniref:lytic cellulose monooxygenase (C4-dehydrogenating) n=1 Tax=Polyplosphaeria fusca TaxID=682080 RepID=A0A9P4V0Q5_9PLEO|nr:hypothetical protein EJ04DRAFT_566087 [Polyplosphaeria fusca]
MKCRLDLVLFLHLAGQGSAHYVLNRFILNNAWTKEFDFVRSLGPLLMNESDYLIGHPLKPNEDPTSITLRCGPNGTTSGHLVGTANINAGDTVGFGVGEPHFRYGNYPYDVPRIYHPGPASVWLSKAPNDDVESYTGDGDWVKIYNFVTRTEQSMPVREDPTYAHQSQWATYLTPSWNFTIPKTTPPGKYLLRFEHILAGDPNGSFNEQYYANCAQVNIKNDGEIGMPGPLVKIPGIYVKRQPEFIFGIWNATFNVSQFNMPGPAPWNGS